MDKTTIHFFLILSTNYFYFINEGRYPGKKNNERREAGRIDLPHRIQFIGFLNNKYARKVMIKSKVLCT